MVRSFILESNTTDRRDAEARIADLMKQITGDQEWTSTPPGYKTLTLEHHMAARRAGFGQLFEALQVDDSLRTGLLDGSLPSLRLFTHDVLPLVEALRANDAFVVAALVRQRSPLLSVAVLKAAGGKQEEKLAEFHTSVESLASLWTDLNASPTFLEVLQVDSKFRLFEIAELLANILQRTHAFGPDVATNAEDEAADPQNATTVALQNFLMVPLEETGPYADYVSGPRVIRHPSRRERIGVSKGDGRRR